MRRLEQLEDENAKLRKVVADLSLDKEMLTTLTPLVHQLAPMDENERIGFSLGDHSGGENRFGGRMHGQYRPSG